MLSWQDSPVVTYLRLISQEPSGCRRTKHHLKAQWTISSSSSAWAQNTQLKQKYSAGGHQF